MKMLGATHRPKSCGYRNCRSCHSWSDGKKESKRRKKRIENRAWRKEHCG